MSKNVKIVLGIVAGILLVCCVSTIILAMFLPKWANDFAENSLITDPAQVDSSANNMLDLTFPASFSERMGMQILGISTVFASTADSASTIILMQFPPEMDENSEEMQQQLETAFNQQRGRDNISWEQVGDQTVTINGQPSTLIIYEGTNEAGEAVRQMLGTFTSKDGNTGMMMLYGSSDDWETDGLESFLESLQ